MDIRNGVEVINSPQIVSPSISGGTVSIANISLTETTTPTATDSVGKVYTKSDNKLYFQDGAGTEHEITLAA